MNQLLICNVSVQNYMAEAAGPAQNHQTGGVPDQGYNPYAAAQGSVYASPPSNATGHAAQSGGYGAVYGNYGY